MYNQSKTGMDRVVSIPLWKKPFFIWTTLGILLIIGLSWITLGFYQRQQVPIISRSDISLTTVAQSNFSDILTTRATFEPASTTFIDAGLTGIVEKIHVGNGSIVRKSDPIITLTNPSIDMQIMKERGQISERLSGLDKQDLELQKTIINRRSELDKITFDNLRAERELSQNKHLHGLDLVSDAALDESKANLDYQKKRLKLSEENLKLEKKMLAEYAKRNQKARQLATAQISSLSQRASNLQVRASRGGIITGLDVALGQQVTEGTRIAAIGDADRYQLNAELDEYYIDKINVGITGHASIGQNSVIRISEIKPTVTDGKFSVKLAFVKPPQMNFRRGQSVDISLSLSNDETVLTLPRNIYDGLPNRQKIYVLTQGEKYAQLRTIRFGRKNKEHVEILSGTIMGATIISRHDTGLTKEKIQIK